MTQNKTTTLQTSETKPADSVISLTEKAINFVKSCIQKNTENDKPFFRISVEGGGCSGFQYNFSFDVKKENDLVISCGDIEILMDLESKNYLAGSTLDYVDDIRGTGFNITNPKATATCGCGLSFSV